ncbi:MAG: hypothetical protein ACK55Z_04855 [bacterium]
MKIEELHGKILHSVAGNVVEVNQLPVGPPGADLCDKGSFLTFLFIIDGKKTLLLLSRGRKVSFDRITSKLC